MSIVKKYEAYIQEEVDIYLENGLESEHICNMEDREFYKLVGEIKDMIVEDDDFSKYISRHIEKLARKALADKGIPYSVIED